MRNRTTGWCGLRPTQPMSPGGSPASKRARLGAVGLRVRRASS
jgi:hypothetical protein